MENYKNLLNTFINIIALLILLYLLYDLYIDYKQNKDFQDNNITSYNDLEYLNDKYQNCELYNLHNKLSDLDKEYLYHLINAYKLKYKEDKPKLTKKTNILKSQIFYNMLITLLLKGKLSSAADTFKHNALLTILP